MSVEDTLPKVIWPGEAKDKNVKALVTVHGSTHSNKKNYAQERANRTLKDNARCLFGSEF